MHISNTNIQILLAAAKKLNLDSRVIHPQKPIIEFSHYDQTHRITGKSLGINHTQAIALTRDKYKTNQMLRDLVATPAEINVSKTQELESLELPSLPWVIKPAQGQKGHHVYIGVKDLSQGKALVQELLDFYQGVLIQAVIPGQDIRFLVLDGQVIGIASREPASITGDGHSSIKELIDQHNRGLLLQREQTGKRMQNRLLNWPRMRWHLENQGLSLETILEKDRKIHPHPLSNFQAGGTVKTLKIEELHPDLTKLAEGLTKKTGLRIAGIDMLVRDLSKLPEENATLIEINSDPSLRLHEWPNQGESQPVARKILEAIFNLRRQSH